VTILNPPGYVQSGSYTAALDRMNLVTLLHEPDAAASAAFGLGARGGLVTRLPNADASYSIVGGTGWNIVVGPFGMLVTNDFAANAGDYLVAKTGNDTVTLTASSPTQSRVDIIAVQVVDQFYSGSVTEGRLVVLQGTPSSGTPSAPAIPPSCEPIVECVVNAGSTSPVLVDRRKRAGVIGGILPINGNQFADAGIYAGETQYYEALGTFRVWRGGSTNAWRAFGGMLARSGSQLITSATLPTGGAANVSQVSLSDPGGIWAAQGTHQQEYHWTPTGDGRIDLYASLDGLGGAIIGTALPVFSAPSTVVIAQGAGMLSGPLTGSRTVWFNMNRPFGSEASVQVLTFNFRTAAIQLLLRAT
jgi:hypothetical protein